MICTTSFLSLLSLVALVTSTESNQRWKRNPFKIPEFLKFGRCANVEGQLTENFESEKYSGLWFDIESVPNDYQHVKKCVTQTYIWTDETMHVHTRGLTKDDEKIRQIASMAIEMKTAPANDTAHMTVTAEGVPAAPYQIVDTDYHNYACVYSCLSYVAFKAEFSWVFGRGPVLAQEFIEKCHDKFRELNVDPAQMNTIFQADPDVCPYWEKLPKMLGDSKTKLTTLLGPDDLATGSSPSRTIDEMLAILSTSGSSGTAEQDIVMQDMAPKLHTAVTKGISSSGSSSHPELQDDEDDQEESSRATHIISSSAYPLSMLMTVLLTILMH